MRGVKCLAQKIQAVVRFGIKVQSMSALKVTAGVVACAAEAVLLVPFTVASGLLAPLWAVVMFYMVGAVAFVSLILLLRKRFLVWSLLVPFIHAIVFVSALTFGDIFLSWTA